jgi:hypothetical protein
LQETIESEFRGNWNEQCSGFTMTGAMQTIKRSQ